MQRSASVRVLAESTEAHIEESSEPASPDGVSSNEADDMERLFPDPHVRELLHEIAGDLRRVAGFVQRIDKELKAEKFDSETNQQGCD
jgi:hypothetical protein